MIIRNRLKEPMRHSLNTLKCRNLPTAQRSVFLFNELWYLPQHLSSSQITRASDSEMHSFEYKIITKSRLIKHYSGISIILYRENLLRKTVDTEPNNTI